MTREEIMALDAEGIQERRTAIKSMDIDKLSDEEVRAMQDEVSAIEERYNQLKEAAETRKAFATKVAGMKVEGRKVVDNKEEKKMPTIEEIRSSREYGVAFLNGLRSNDYAEARALLTDAVSNGQIAVPTQLETEIKNAWEDCKLLALCKHSNFSGNVKIGFELSATGAVVHVEGTAAPAEEELTLGYIEIKAEDIMKWISVSKEALINTTIDTIGYLYKEIAQKIAEAAEAKLVAKIIAAPAASTATAAAVAVYTAAAVAVDTITMALAELSGKAKNVKLAMNRRTYAALKATAKKANYAVDPFDGCEVVYTDALPAISAASTGDTYIIAGDFGYGAQVNSPSGNTMSLLTDYYTEATKGMVRVIGDQMIGVEVVAEKAFVKVVK